MALSVYNAKESLEKLQNCVMALSVWMTGSKLKLNPSKTDFLLIGTKLQREKILNNSPCLILGQDTNPSASAKNLGVVFDSRRISEKTYFKKDIYSIYQTCRACFYHIMRRYASLYLSKQIAVALVSSKLDYCDSLFQNMPEKDIAR